MLGLSLYPRILTCPAATQASLGSVIFSPAEKVRADKLCTTEFTEIRVVSTIMLVTRYCLALSVFFARGY